MQRDFVSNQMVILESMILTHHAKLHLDYGSQIIFIQLQQALHKQMFFSQTTNKAGLLLHRQYRPMVIMVVHLPSSITSYRKGGIYYKTTGSGFGRGDLFLQMNFRVDNNTDHFASKMMVVYVLSLIQMGSLVFLIMHTEM